MSIDIRTAADIVRHAWRRAFHEGRGQALVSPQDSAFLALNLELFGNRR